MTPSQMSLGILTSNFNLLLLLDEAADAHCEDKPYGDLLLQVGEKLKKYLYTKCFWNRVSWCMGSSLKKYMSVHRQIWMHSLWQSARRGPFSIRLTCFWQNMEVEVTLQSCLSAPLLLLFVLREKNPNFFPSSFWGVPF